jgi:hypothetical protein
MATKWKSDYSLHLHNLVSKRKLRRNPELAVINYILETHYGEGETFDDYGETTDGCSVKYRRLHLR